MADPYRRPAGLFGAFAEVCRTQPAGKVDTSNFYGTDSDYDKSTTDSGTLRFEHDLTENTTVCNTPAGRE